MVASKILPFESCQETFAQLRDEGRHLVHCHGAFDLLHFGHLKHLEEARSLGDVLVVTITSAPFVNKGPGRPVFSDEQRAYHLSHLGLVDYVVIVPKSGAVEIIEKVRPHSYCKGIEYETPKNETDRRIDEDSAAVERGGGKICFVGAPLASSTHLIAANMDVLDPEVREYLESFAKDDELARKIDETVTEIAKLRVLVVGDLIIDRYTYCRVQGLTTKARVLSVRPQVSKDALGGSLAIARHVTSFGCSTRLVALAGEEPWLASALDQAAGDLDFDLVQDPDYQTIVKERFVERPGQRKDLLKYFSVNRLQDAPSAPMKERLLAKLTQELERCDMVILCDYGHGMVDSDVQALLEEKSPFLALNCQTNSYNHGFNLITKYARCDLFSLDERELGLAFGDRVATDYDLLQRLSTQLGSDYGWLTLGSAGSVVQGPDRQPHSCPAMVKTTIDTVGAGDAFYAVAALCGRVGADVGLTSILSNLAGAMAANIVGNESPISKEAVVKNARYLLKSVGHTE
jgi:cytidyltransferase-like protein